MDDGNGMTNDSAQGGNQAGAEADTIVIGGGLVGSALALGLARGGQRVCVLDGGDGGFVASRGNFALVWVQSKGLGMPEYALWTRQSAQDWGRLAQILADEAGIDVAHRQCGGFSLCLSQAELEQQAALMRALYSQPGLADFAWELLDHDATRRRLPAIGKQVAGAIHSPLDGHVNALRLWRALREAGVRRGVRYRSGYCVAQIAALAGGGFRVRGAWGEIGAGCLVLAAGLDNARLAPMVALAAPVRPNKGQIIVTEKTAPFLHYPLATLRQTDEGGVMIGASQEDCGLDGAVARPVLALLAARALACFPHLAGLNVVRCWSALRVMSPDGFPIYEQSQRHPGAFVVTCHSGVTLAAAHVLRLAPAILARQLPAALACFSARRFHVPPPV